MPPIMSMLLPIFSQYHQNKEEKKKNCS